MPVRKGEGTGIKFPGIAEIRKGDGTLLWISISLDVTSTLNTGSASFTLYEDSSGNGEADASNTYDLLDGQNTYDVSMFDLSSGNEVWFRVDFDNGDVTETVTAQAIEVQGDSTISWSASDLDSEQDNSGISHESISNTDNTDASVLKQGYSYGEPHPLNLPPSLPTTIVSRPDDDTQTSVSQSYGLVVNPNSTFTAIGVRISSNTSGVTRARLYDYSKSSYVATIDVSSLSAGDTFVFEEVLFAGQDYGIELDANGNGYTAGFCDSENEYPYTGTEMDIVTRSSGGSLNSGYVININDIGDPDNVLG